MSDELPFDRMQQLDAEFREWRTSQSPQQLREYNRIRAALVKLAKAAGMSKRVRRRGPACALRNCGKQPPIGE